MMVGLHCIVACSNDSLDVVKYLVTECKCDPMSTDNEGWTPLHYRMLQIVHLML